VAQHDERQEIFKALEEYGEKHNAEYYCVILSPHKGEEKVKLRDSHFSSIVRGEAGATIERLVNKEIFFAPIKPR